MIAGIGQRGKGPGTRKILTGHAGHIRLFEVREAVQRGKKKVLRKADEDTVSRWVKLAFAAMRREMDASLRASGMTLTQWRALGMLLHHPGMTHSELVAHLEIEAPSVTSLVNGMERKGWVKRTRSPTDARVKRLSLTPKGKRHIEEARRATAPVEHRMAATLTEEQRTTLKRLLRIMVEGLHSI
jgi:MarR family transcriptional regulator, transcriptional regulator for hemolysin